MENSLNRREFFADGALVFISLIWGSTFIIIKQAIEAVPPAAFLTLRFGTAFFLMLPFCILQWRHINGRVLRDGTILGTVLFLAFLTQTLSLQYTAASVTAFVTGLFIIIVPILSAILLRKFPHPCSIAGVVLAAAGMGLITLNGRFSLSTGELLALLSAFFYSLQIILIDTCSRRNHVTLLTAIQIGVAFVLSGLFSGLTDPRILPEIWSRQLLFAIVLTGVFATVVAFFIQAGVQKYTTPTKATIIYCLEPVSSAFFSYWLGGELLSFRQYAGAGLIVAAMLTAELGTFIRFRESGPVPAVEPVRGNR